MKIKSLFLIATTAFISLTSADTNIIPLEEKPVQKVPLNPYSFGLGIGNVVALNQKWQDKDEQLLKLSFIQTVIVNDNVNVNMDIDWMPSSSWGGSLTADYLLGSGAFRPFLGAGVGLYNINKDTGLGKGFGAAGTAHLGVLVDLMDELQIRIRVPYHFVANSTRDHGLGLDIGFLFSTPQRKTKVEVLHP